MATALIVASAACARGDDGAGPETSGSADDLGVVEPDPDIDRSDTNPDEADPAEPDPDGSDPDEPEVSGPDDESESSDDADDPTPDRAGAGVGWERVDGDPRVFGAVSPVVTALGAGVDEWIAVGRARDGSRALLLWVSSDGHEWSVFDGDGAFGATAAGSLEVRSVHSYGSGFVAVGIEALEPEPVTEPERSEADDDADPALGDDGSPDDPDAIETDTSTPSSSGRVRGAVWLSDDGRVWERMLERAGFLEAEGTVILRSVVPGGPGLVAVGSVDEGTDRRGAVWLSADGEGWLPVAHDPDVFGGTGVTSIEDVVMGDGRLVAVGVAPGIGRETSGAVWFSDDGGSWTAVAHQPLEFGGVGTSVRINAVAAGGPGFVAVGSERSVVGTTVRFEAAVWWSSNGEDWTRVDDADVFAGSASLVLWDVVALDDRVIGVGGDDGRAAVWISDDGREWERLPLDADVVGRSGGATQMQRAVALVDRVVAVGVSDEAVPIWASPRRDA